MSDMLECGTNGCRGRIPAVEFVDILADPFCARCHTEDPDLRARIAAVRARHRPGVHGPYDYCSCGTWHSNRDPNRTFFTHYLDALAGAAPRERGEAAAEENQSPSGGS